MKKLGSVAAAVFLLFSPALAGETGKIAGKVKAKWVEKYQAVVFVLNPVGPKANCPASRPPAGPVMSQMDTTFVPHILPVVAGTTVEFDNLDPFKHNIFSPDGERYNLGSWVGSKGKSYIFKKPGVYRQLCNVHPEMLAYIVVLETPCFGLTDMNGNFEIAGVPAGKYSLGVWGEKLTTEQLARGFEMEAMEGKTAHVEIDLQR